MNQVEKRNMSSCRIFRVGQLVMKSMTRLKEEQDIKLIRLQDSVFLQKVMDPPRPEVVDDALELLFGEAGMLREGIIIGILMDTQPLPIIRPFGQEALGCRNGSSCVFSHDSDHASLLNNRQALCIAEDLVPEAPLLLRPFPSPYDGCILIFDDFDMQFSANFAQFYEPSSIVLTTSAVKYSIEPSLQDLKIIWGLSYPHGTIISKAANNSIPWKKIKSAIWIPKFSNDIENWEEQKGLLKTFFEYLAIRILGDSLYEVQVIIVMNNIRFAQLQATSMLKTKLGIANDKEFPFVDYKKYSRVMKWTLGLSGDKDQIASGSISRVRGPISSPSSGIIADQFIEKICKVLGRKIILYLKK